MKECRNRRKHLIDLLEDQLSDEDRADLLEHIKHCAECAQEYSKLMNLSKIMESDRVEYPSADAFERMKSVARRKVLHPKRRFLWRLFRVSAPAFALALILFFLLHDRGETVDMSIPVAHLLEDSEIAEIAVTGIVSADLARAIESLEEELTFNADDAIDEMSHEQKGALVHSLRRRYALGT